MDKNLQLLFDKYKNKSEFTYQEEITQELDNINGDFNQNTINEIIQ